MQKAKILIPLFVGFFWVPSLVFGQDSRLKEWTLEVYDSALAVAEKRFQDAKTGIVQEQAGIEALKLEIAQTQTKIGETIVKTYALLGITQEDVNLWNQQAGNLKTGIEELMALPSDQLITRMNNIKECEKKLEELKANRISWLFDNTLVIGELENLLRQLKSQLPDKAMQYTVRLVPEQRDCLWRIAGYEEIYGNPYEWPKIYSSNKSQINQKFRTYQSVVAVDQQKYQKAEDLIYPGQVFDIPR